MAMNAPPLFPSLSLQGRILAPALFLAPMAGVTNSAFRRLLSDFGGYGALFTEMLSASAFLHEDPATSTWLRRRPCEGAVIYQFRTSGAEDLEAVVAKLAGLDCTALDLNLGCPAPEIQQQASGAALWRDFPRLQSVLVRLRRVYGGPLTVKCRLGDTLEGWQTPFLERLRLFEDQGVDAITVHPRLSTEKLKRRVRWEAFPWIAAQTRIPIIGNGDVCTVQDVETHRPLFEPLAGLMLGRIVAVRPWVFRDFAGLPRLDLDLREIWERMYRYTLEDLPPERARGRLKEFTYYFSRNFVFGHTLWTNIQKPQTPESIRDATLAFLDHGPGLRSEGAVTFA